MNSSLKLLFVINANAGANKISWHDMISNYFTGKQHEVHYFMLKENMDELKKLVATLQPERVIAVGGDGTVTLVAKLVAGTNAALGILPAGSANGMAKELNISLVPEEALNLVENGEVIISDAIKINGKDICLHLADIGLNAQFIKYFDEGKLRGWLGYGKVMIKTLWRSQKITVNFKTDQVPVKEKVFMLVLANASKYGTGAVINPEGKLDDGKFEVVLVRRLSLIEVMKTLFRPSSVNPKKIEAIHVTSIQIQTKRNAHFQIDGEYKGKIRNLEAVIMPKYVKIIRGKETDL
ncbi:MAG: diacylglycerol kinase family protein [Ferruginibacter sp.]